MKAASFTGEVNFYSEPAGGAVNKSVSQWNLLNFHQKTCPSGRSQGYLIFHCLAQSHNSSSTLPLFPYSAILGLCFVAVQCGASSRTVFPLCGSSTVRRKDRTVFTLCGSPHSAGDQSALCSHCVWLSMGCTCAVTWLAVLHTCASQLLSDVSHRTRVRVPVRFFREKYLKPHFGNVSWEGEL